MSTRETIIVIGEHLYFTVSDVLNRLNIKFVADEVIQLLKGSSFESVLQPEATTIFGEAESVDKSHWSRFETRVRGHLLAVLLAVLSNTLISTSKQLTEGPSLSARFWIYTVGDSRWKHSCLFGALCGRLPRRWKSNGAEGRGAV